MVDVALYGATLGVWSLIVFLSLWVFYLLRQDPTLEHRSVPLTIFSSIVSIILIVFYMLRAAYQNEMPCWLGLWFESILWPLWWLIFVCRCGRLIFLHRSTRSKFTAALTLVQRKSSTFARSLTSRKSFSSMLHSPSIVSLVQRSNSIRSHSRSFSASQSIISNNTIISYDRRRRTSSPVPPVPPLPAYLRDGTKLMPPLVEPKQPANDTSSSSEFSVYLTMPAKTTYMNVPSQNDIAIAELPSESPAYSGRDQAMTLPSSSISPLINTPRSRAQSYFAEPALPSTASETIYERPARGSIGSVFEIPERDFYYRNRVWVSTRSILNVILVLGGVFIISTSIAFGLSERMLSGMRDNADCRFGPEFYPMHIFTLLYSVVVLPVMLTIYYRAADTYGLLVELCVTAVLGAFLSIFQLVMSASPSIRRQVEEIQPLGNWLAFYLVAVHLMTVISPTAVVWVFTYLLKDTTSEDEFMDVLHRPSEFQKFCKYAIGEFSVENPLFYDRCRSIMEDGHHGRRHCSTQTREELRKIYDAFLQPNAPLEINLPYHLRKAIDEQVNGNKWSTKMFEEARWEVWRLMYQHTYPRYIRSGNSKRK